MTRYFMKTKTLVSSVALAALATACGGLDVTNTTNPDAATVVSNASDVQSVVSNQFENWFTTTQDTYPANALAAMSDDMTSSFGNFGMRFNSNEPRIAYGNVIGGSDEAVAKNPWNNNYSAVGAVNDGLRAIANGLKVVSGGVDNTSQVQAIAYFVNGATYGNLALQFDRAFVTDETYQPGVSEKPTLEPYTSVSTKAVALLDKSIAAAAVKPFTTDKVYTNKAFTNVYLAKLANTMAARILAYTPRTKAENDAVNWAKVLGYANNGISTGTAPADFSLTGDGGTLWYDLFKAYSERGTWMRVDNKVIKMMDPSYPIEATSTANQPRCACTDLRVTGSTPDFVYKTSIPFNSARGVYHFSNYAHERYFYHTYDAGNPLTGEMPMILAAENDLLIAEALVRTNGDRQRAADLINKTRVGRGGLAALSAASGDAALLAGIFYERHVELLGTGAGLSFYDRRRQDELQPGTPLHLPIPASELQTLGMPIYTFGGAAPNPVYPVK